ncbi:MAG: mannosyl-3-phosphoglycerate synthase [Acidobacteriota bacterium]|jgi:mannosyl-3-phosphoglycerate synthase
MRIELPKAVERFGSVRFGELQRVFELDSGLANGANASREQPIRQVPYEELSEIHKRTAIVVPIKGERLKLVEGVLCGIPHPCLIIMVSNSPTRPVDRFHLEADVLRDFCTFTGKHALLVHQKDPILTTAFEQAGYKEILNRQGRIRDGKAEGMLIGTLLASLAGKDYVGFVDADNYFPGAVEEYIREYAAGFAISRSDYSMVRIAWHSKPKIVESKLFFRKWGRTSSRTNEFLNRLISHYTGFDTEVIKTGNAGEHALTMELANTIGYSAGYSIEPNHLIDLLERFGGVIEPPAKSRIKDQVEVYQIESRNPHLHEAGDQEHIREMSYQALSVVYHSRICPPKLKTELRREAVTRGFIEKGTEPTKPHYFPSLNGIDRDRFRASIESTPYGRMAEEEAESRHRVS